MTMMFSLADRVDLVEAEEDGEPSSLPSDSVRPHRKASSESRR